MPTLLRRNTSRLSRTTPKFVAGTPTRQNRPRCEYAIDPETAPWVVRVFRWFVEEGLSLAEIIRRLNGDAAAPLGPKAVSGRWTRLAVKLLLANPRYRGFWLYGRTEAVWQAKQDYARQLPREQPLSQRQFEETLTAKRLEYLGGAGAEAYRVVVAVRRVVGEAGRVE